MSSPETRLTVDDSTIYANVRSVAGLFSAHAVVFIFLGVLFMRDTGSASHPGLQIAGGAALVLLGLAGLMGGVAIVARKRRLARLIYGAVALKVLAFPVGTICSVYLVWRLPRYLQILEVLEAARVDDPSAIPVDHPSVAYFLQRYRRSRRWLYFFAVLLPFSCVGPCSIGTVVPNQEAKGILVVSGFFLSIVALSGGILMLNDLLKYRGRAKVRHSSN